MLPYLKAFRSNGEVADMLEIDAKAAAVNHPREWSLTPWNTKQIKEAQRDELRHAASEMPAGPAAMGGKSAIDLQMAKLSGATSYNGNPIV